MILKIILASLFLQAIEVNIIESEESLCSHEGEPCNWLLGNTCCGNWKLSYCDNPDWSWAGTCRQCETITGKCERDYDCCVAGVTCNKATGRCIRGKKTIVCAKNGQDALSADECCTGLVFTHGRCWDSCITPAETVNKDECSTAAGLDRCCDGFDCMKSAQFNRCVKTCLPQNAKCDPNGTETCCAGHRCHLDKTIHSYPYCNSFLCKKVNEPCSVVFDYKTRMRLSNLTTLKRSTLLSRRRANFKHDCCNALESNVELACFTYGASENGVCLQCKKESEPCEFGNDCCRGLICDKEWKTCESSNPAIREARALNKTRKTLEDALNVLIKVRAI